MRRSLFFCTGLLLLGQAQAQNDYRKVLVDNPYMCNGYFIKDLQKCREAGIASISVEVRARRSESGNTMDRVLQTIDLSSGLFGQVDPARLQELQPGERAYYHLTAMDAGGNTVVDYAALPVGGGEPGTIDPVCATTCQAPTYAWTIHANQSLSAGKTYLTMDDAYSPYGYYYFYVQQSDWGWWHLAHHAGDFGLPDLIGYEDWDGYTGNTGQTQVVRLDANLPGGGGGAPDGALSWEGNGIAQHTPVYAIRKDRGAYRVFWAQRTLDCIGCDALCSILPDLYNGGAEVQQQLAQHNLPPIICPAMPSLDGIGSLSMSGENPFTSCTNLPVPANGNLFAWMNSVLDCIGNIGNGSSGGSGGSGGNGGSGGIGGNITYHTVLVNRWRDDGTSDRVFSVAVPAGKDPKLVQVDKTELTPGLYEFVAVLSNGQIMRHFEAFSENRIINADFADFINVNIYPVPVKGKEFAIDIDMVVPGNVGITIVNNMGTPYYTKQLHFDLPGRNKHVVYMGEQWPAGLYHAVFQYGDGSSTFRNFTVEQ